MQKKLSKKLKQIRMRAGLSQSELVRALNYKASPLRASQISQFESGKREPNGLLLLAYARFAGVSTEVLIDDPIMANGPGTPGFDPPVYNRRFVFWCYQTYLDRDPTGDPGWDFWTNVLNSDNNYAHIIDAFQLSTDYRNDRVFF